MSEIRVTYANGDPDTFERGDVPIRRIVDALTEGRTVAFERLDSPVVALISGRHVRRVDYEPPAAPPPAAPPEEPPERIAEG